MTLLPFGKRRDPACDDVAYYVTVLQERTFEVFAETAEEAERKVLKGIGAQTAAGFPQVISVRLRP